MCTKAVACSCVAVVQISLGIIAALGLRLLLAGATRATADRQQGADGRGRQREYERYEQQRQQQRGYGGPAWPGAGGQTGREQGRRQPAPMFFGAWGCHVRHYLTRLVAPGVHLHVPTSKQAKANCYHVCKTAAPL